MRRWIEPLRRPPRTLGLALVCLVALAIRLFVAAVSNGSDDIRFWLRFGKLVSQHGVLQAYVLDTWFNHPPLMGWMGAAAYKLAVVTGWSFDVLFKLPSILASVAAIVLVQHRARLGWAALVLFALNPTDVLISSYHGNTDALCAFACAAAVLLAERGRPLACGLTLAAALNVKLIPVILVLPLAACFRGRERLRYGAALSLGALPFLPPLLWVRDAFLKNAIFYNSFKANWGIGLFTITSAARLPRLSAALWTFAQAAGKPLVLASSAVWALAQARWRAFGTWELAGLAVASFLVLAPGFGVQYLIYPTALLMIADRGLGLRYVYLAGVFVTLVYLTYWTGTVPVTSFFMGPFDLFASLFGLMAWLMLGRHVARALRRLFTGRGAGAGSDEGTQPEQPDVRLAGSA